MPIKKFINGKMEAAEIKRLNLAYAKALRMLDLVDRIDPVTRIVAEKVIKIGTSGVTDLCAPDQAQAFEYERLARTEPLHKPVKGSKVKHRGAPAKGVEEDCRASASFCGAAGESLSRAATVQQRKSSSISSLSRQPLAEVRLQRQAMTARARA